MEKPSFFEKLGFWSADNLQSEGHMRKEKLQSGEIYHIYNRGVNRDNIFFSPDNWVFFLRRWQKICTTHQGETLAYCLMPNHYHLLVRVFVDDFGLRVMQPFTVSYTKAVNKQEGRVGPLFQGPFQAKAGLKQMRA